MIIIIQSLFEKKRDFLVLILRILKLTLLGIARFYFNCIFEIKKHYEKNPVNNVVYQCVCHCADSKIYL